MSRLNILTHTALVACLGLLATSAFAKKRVYTLVCHGGGNMSAEYKVEIKQSEPKAKKKKSKRRRKKVKTSLLRQLVINLKPAMLAAETRMPDAGTCAVLNKRMTKRAPKKMIVVFKQDKTGGEFVSKLSIGNTGVKIDGVQGDRLNAILTTIPTDRQFFYVRARIQKLDGEYVFQVTRPGKTSIPISNYIQTVAERKLRF